MDKLFVVIPAYNEEENIRQVVEDWYPVVEKHNGEGESRLVIIDDGSKDSTFESLKSCAENKPLLLPLTKPNGGHGATVLYGYHYALAMVPRSCMGITMHWIMMRITFFKRTPTARHCRRNLNPSGQREKTMTW